MSRPGPAPTDTSQYTRGEAAQALAVALAAPGAASWLAGWSSREIQCGVGCQHPQNNLWACGQYVPGASDWNQAGVKNYPTLAAGIAATVLNLNDTNYPAYQNMVDALRMGDFSSERVQAGLRAWCGSVCYSADAGNFVAEGQAHASDVFDGSAGSLPTTGGTGTSAPDTATLKSCLFGLPGQCLTDWTCWPIGPSGRPLCSSSFATPFSSSRCFPPGTDFTQQCDDGSGKVASGTGGAVPGGTGSIFNLSIAGWNSNRIVKWLLGLALVGFGLLLLFSILTEKAEGNPLVQGTTKAVAALAA